MRSLLFVPADDERKLAKATLAGADVLLIDLEDAVAPARKEAARATAAAFLTSRAPGGPAVYIRVNGLDTGMTGADLDAIVAAAPDGIMLPKVSHGRDLEQLGAKLAVREAEAGLADGATRIIAIAPEQAAAMFGLGTIAGASHRLAGLTWGAEDLAADIGAAGSREADGSFRPPMHQARMACLFAAAAAGVPAIDTVFTAIRDDAALKQEAAAALAMGYTAKLAIHPGQIPVINGVFTPSAAQIAHAQAIAAAFAANPGAGVFNLGGKMVDRPHLRAAEALLARAAASGLV